MVTSPPARRGGKNSIFRLRTINISIDRQFNPRNARVAEAITPTAEEIQALVGHRFPGGNYTIAHWENFLLTECTGADPLPGDLAHPVALFHMPILGAGTSIGEMFALGQAESDSSIGIESYEWVFFQPMREEHQYRVEGEITQADRRVEGERTFDRIAFQFDLMDDAGVATARTTITWHYRRSTQA
jgi:hypothetical protein